MTKKVMLNRSVRPGNLFVFRSSQCQASACCSFSNSLGGIALNVSRVADTSQALVTRSGDSAGQKIQLLDLAPISLHTVTFCQQTAVEGMLGTENSCNAIKMEIIFQPSNFLSLILYEM